MDRRNTELKQGEPLLCRLKGCLKEQSLSSLKALKFRRFLGTKVRYAHMLYIDLGLPVIS